MTDETVRGFAPPGSRGWRICAGCRVAFGFLAAQQMPWCSVNEVYYCPRCRPDRCSAHRGRGTDAAVMGSPAYAVLLLLSVPAALGGGVVPAYDLVQNSWFASLPVTPIGDLSPGMTSKIEGTIQSNSGVALGTYEYSSLSSWVWRWNLTDVFWFEDGSGTVAGDVRGHFFIEETGPPAPYLKETRGPAYRNGDRVVAVGKLGAAGGLAVFEVVYLGYSGTAFRPDWSSLVIGSITWSITIAILYIPLRNLARRGRVHRTNTEGEQPQTPALVKLSRPPGLHWMRNTLPGFKVTSRIAAAGTIGAGLLLIGLIWWSQTPHDKLAAFQTGVIAGPILSLFVVVPSIVLLAPRSGPDEIAVSSTGIHFWYRDPMARFMHAPLIRWSDITGIAVEPLLSRKAVVVRSAGGVEMRLNLVMGRQEVLAVQKAWKVIRGKRLAPREPDSLLRSS